MNVFEAYAVESKLVIAKATRHAPVEASQPTLRASSTTWMEEMQDEAEADLLRYELEHGGRFSSAADTEFDSRS